MDIKEIEAILESSESEENFSIFDSSSSSESDEEAVDGVLNFLDTIENFSSGTFKSHFRLNRSTANSLIDIYASSEVIRGMQKGGRQRVGANKEIYIFLWYISNTNTFRELGNLFHVSKSTAWNVVARVSSWLVSISHDHIKWPSSDEVESAAARWEEKKKIPGVIGAIDCTHISIIGPKNNKECYFNRNRYYSVHLQAVVDVDKRFIDIFVGEPGSLHDGRVLRRSDLYSKATSGANGIFANGNRFLIGDSAYPLTNWLIPPFRDNGHLTTVQSQFNYLHSSASIVVEHSFGMLKTRFRRLLHFFEHLHLEFVVNLTVAACVLHNICISENDIIHSDNISNDADEDTDPEPEDNSLVSNRREQLIDCLLRTNRIRA